MLRGEAGIGKTALLEFLLDRGGRLPDRPRRPASSPRWSSPTPACTSSAARTWIGSTGCRARSATPSATAFGLRPGRAPDRLLVGWRSLTLLSRGRPRSGPLLCVVDDAQWLDQASTQTLEFVARRLRAESVAMVFAVRESDEEPVLAGLPELHRARAGAAATRAALL